MFGNKTQLMICFCHFATTMQLLIYQRRMKLHNSIKLYRILKNLIFTATKLGGGGWGGDAQFNSIWKKYFLISETVKHK